MLLQTCRVECYLYLIIPKNDKEIDDCLDEANAYLKKLGWAAKLSHGDDWVVQLFPIPERQFPSFNLTFLLWAFSALTLTLAGAYWMEGSRPSGGWFHNSSFLDAVLGYTLPVLGSLFIASHIQKRIAFALQSPCRSYHTNSRTDDFSLESRVVISILSGLALWSLSHSNIAQDGCSTLG